MEDSLDFILKERDYGDTVFRFLPRKSHCHGFRDKPPKKWSEVYKVYYSYKVFFMDEILFEERCDECSIIDAVAHACKKLSKKDEPKFLTTYIPCGTGTTWKIEKINNEDLFYEIAIFKFNGIGYRFTLDREQLGEFGEYLEFCCEYMLEHSEGI